MIWYAKNLIHPAIRLSGFGFPNEFPHFPDSKSDPTFSYPTIWDQTVEHREVKLFYCIPYDIIWM